MDLHIRKTNLNGVMLNSQNTILSAALIIAASNGINAFLGFLKGRLLAAKFGVSDELAVFYTADKIPNLIYSVLVVGAVSTVFIPIFVNALKKDKEDAYKQASAMVTVTTLLFLVITVLIFVFSKPILELISLGKFNSENVALGASLMKIMMAGQILLVLGSVATSILQSFKYFLVAALAPLAYSIGMIAGIVFLSQQYGIYAPALGVLIGAFLHFIIQIPAIARTGFKYTLELNLKNEGLGSMASLIPPRIVSVLLANLIQVVNNSLAIIVSTPSVIFLRFASQLQYFPVNLFGVPLGTASLPTLSTQGNKDDMDKFKKTFTTSLMQMLYLVLPLSTILLVLRVPVVRIVYGVANFPWEATLKTSYTLAFFAISIFAQSTNYLLTRAFYALKDTKTPVLVSICTTFLNIGLSLFFIEILKYGVWAVAFSFSITAIIDMAALFVLLNKKVGGFNFNLLLSPLIKISYASLAMGGALYFPVKLLDNVIFDTTKTINLLILVGIAGVLGLASYLVITAKMHVKEVDMFYKLTRKLAPVKKAVPFVSSEEQY